MADLIAHVGASMAMLALFLGSRIIKRVMPKVLNGMRNVKNPSSTTERLKAGNGESLNRMG